MLRIGGFEHRVGGLPWIAYGVRMGASPVIAAKLIVGAAALLTALRSRNTNAGFAQLVPALAATEIEPPHCD